VEKVYIFDLQREQIFAVIDKNYLLYQTAILDKRRNESVGVSERGVMTEI